MKSSNWLGGAALTMSVLCFGTVTAHADALADITKAKTIRIATDFGVPPSGMMDATMKPIGSDVETAQLLAQDWGLKLEFVQTTGATRIPNLLTGKADIAISTLSLTPDRAKIIDFSKAYAVLESVIAGRQDINVHTIDDLKGKTVCVTRGTTQDVELSKIAREKDFQVARYDDDATDVTAAVSGQCDLISTSMTIVKQINLKGPKSQFDKKVLLHTFDISIGVKKGEPALLAKLNQWIAINLKNGKLNAIYKKYHGVDLPPEMR